METSVPAWAAQRALRPYWARKDNGAWSIPKGEYAPGEDALAAAQREFTEETGFPVSGPFKPLRPVKQSGGKVISAWAAAGDLDPSRLQSNSFALEWPPKSGTIREYPEVDRGAWFPIAEARIKLIPGTADAARAGYGAGVGTSN